MIKLLLKNHKRLRLALLSMAVLATSAGVVVRIVMAMGLPLYPVGIVYYLDPNNGKQPGDSTTPNSAARAYAYRTNIDNQLSTTDSDPVPGQIYVAANGDPAYTSWDVGSSQWSNVNAGDVATLITETRNGLNGWTGSSWVGGAKVTITAAMLQNLEIDYREIVMEKIPTPTMQSSTTSSITIHWQGLWDNSTGAAGGVGPASVVGYSIYRSVDGGSYSLISGTDQSAGGNIAYTDSAVSSGHNYSYKLGVRFEWDAHNPAYFEPTAQSDPSTAFSVGVPQPIMLKYLSSAPSFVAGTNSAVQTVQSTDAGGNAANVTSDTTVNLTSNTTGTNAKFLAVSAGACTTTVITNVTIASGSATAQFCYYDEKAGSWTLTAASTGLTSATQTATVTSTATLGSLSLSLTPAQKDRITFTGTNTLTAKDNFGNTMTGFNAASDIITFTTAPNTATISGLNGTGGAQLSLASDFVNGVANLAGKLKLSGTSNTYTVTISSASGKTDSASVNLGGGALDHFDFVLATPQSIATAFTGTNSLTARDADNNIITSFDASATNVTISESAGSGTVSGLGSGNNAVINRSSDFTNGVANLAGALNYVGPVGAHTFKATAGSVNTTSNGVSFSPGPFAKFGVSLTTPQANGQAFTSATITAQDTYGNTLSSFDASQDAVTLSVSGSGSLNTTSLNSSNSFVNGVATLSGSLTFTGQATTHTITATAASGKTGNASVTITAGTPTSAKIVDGQTSSASPITTKSLTADQTLGLYAAGYDISNNWAGLLNGTWTSSGNLAPAINTSASNTITFAPTTAPASGTISFTGSTLSASTGTITVTPGVINHFVLAAPGNATAGTPISVSITAVDADGNTVTGYTGNQTLSFSGPGNGPTGGSPTYPPSISFSGGVASNVSVTLVKSETVKLKTTQGSVNGTSGDIVVSGGPTTGFTLAAPGTATAGTAFNVQITAYDQFGNVDTGYAGGHTLSFANPSDAPDGTHPSYPSSVTFGGGVGTASVTLFKLENTTLKATESSLVGTSSTIAVSAGAATSIEQVSGDNQTGPVSQILPLAPKVIVKDAYKNPKGQYTVSFNIASGGGSLSTTSAITGTDGTAQTNWTLGNMPGIDNNKLQAVASGLAGSPVVFTASATGNGFLVTVPGSMKTGENFTVQIKAVDMNGATVTSYSGSKTLVFSGPSDGPNGDKPSYPVTVTFVDGVAQPAPTVSLVAVETTSLTVADTAASLSGTSSPFTVNVGDASKITIVTPPQEVIANAISKPITACIQDQYGNAIIASDDRSLNFAGTSQGSMFSTSPDGPWNSYTAILQSGLNCLSIYYKDSYAGARSVTISSQGLSEASQSIVVQADGGSNSGSTGSASNNATGTTTTLIRTVTVYVDRPTTESNIPSTSPTTTIAIPISSLPIITSPGQSAFIASIDGNVVFEGTAPAKQTLRIITDTGNLLGSATSDESGQWRARISEDKFKGAQQSVYAQLVNGTRGSSVQFALKQPALLERIVDFISE